MIKSKFFLILITILSVLIVPTVSKASVVFDDVYNTYDYYKVPDFPTDSYKSHDLERFIYLKDDYFYLVNVLGCNRFRHDRTSVNNSIDVYRKYSGDLILIYRYKCPANDISQGWTGREELSSYTSPFSIPCGENAKIIYSSLDIPYVDGSVVSDEIFFPQTQLGLALKLGKPMKVVDLLKMTNKMMEMIIPIGLAIFSTVLVIFLIKSKKWRHI